MIVDDAPFVRELLKAALKEEGHLCVGEAEDGQEAVALAGRTLPDLIFLDLVLPKMNGLQVAQAVREIWPEVKIIACSTLTQDEVPEKDLMLLDAWMGKPFDLAKLRRTIGELWGTSSKTEVHHD